MNTKERILDEALTLFSEKGYANVFVGEIAERVGIKAPSLYKHFKSKQDIFDGIIATMQRRFLDAAQRLKISGNDSVKDAAIYRRLSEKQLVKLGTELFEYQLHDDYIKRIRKMLTLEQFRNPELAKIYMDQYVDDPLRYHGVLIGTMVGEDGLSKENVEIMTIQFYAPFYMYLTICDRDSSREAEAIKLLQEHIRQFHRIYGRKEK